MAITHDALDLIVQGDTMYQSWPPDVTGNGGVPCTMRSHVWRGGPVQ